MAEPVTAAPNPAPPQRRGFAAWAQRARLARRLALVLTFAALASGIATYAALTGSPPFGPGRRTILVLIMIDLALLLPLAVLVAHRLVRLWVERRRREAGSRLHARLALLFGLLAATPAVIVAAFSILFFNQGLEAWFSSKVFKAFNDSTEFMRHYVLEKENEARVDMEALIRDVNQNALELMNQPRLFGPYVSARASERSITGIYAFDAKGRTYVETGLGLLSAQKQDIEAAAANLKGEEIQSVASRKRGLVTGLVKLPVYFDSDVYLYMERPIAQEVITHVDALSETLDEFERLTGARAELQIGFYALFALVSLLMLLAAVWLGFMIADQIARPISQLINAAERVAAGDLRARVNAGEPGDEVAILSRSFNRMTSQLERNREELVEANRQIDARREFTETVLEGVTAGVIGIDAETRINLPNRHASELLATNLQERIGRPLTESAPEFANLLASARLAPQRGVDGEIEIRRGEKRRTLFVRIAAEEVKGEIVGYVVTFDDITELQQAQRKAAWADVARRIAHEIKNPLTPIQLSAERLKRKYLPEIAGDRENFALYTDTIIRQVGDIGRLVDEFSSFARMPVPAIRPEDLREVCRHAVFLERNAHPDIDYALLGADRPLVVPCDGRQVSQALINLLRNAADAIEEPRRDLSKEAQAALPRGRIETSIEAEDSRVRLVVSDNGRGLPAHLVHKLTEPYVTTRAKGTGLGLAIARKIVEDHGGSIRLENREGGGARITLELPRPADTDRTVPLERAAE